MKSEEAALISKLQEIEEEREKIAEDTQQQKKELEKLEVEEERYLCYVLHAGNRFNVHKLKFKKNSQKGGVVNC